MVFIQEYLSVTKKNNFEGGDDYKMKMNSLISWVGGKKSIRDLIYARFPQSYGRYIEVFGGGGWVLFGKSQISLRSIMTSTTTFQICLRL